MLAEDLAVVVALRPTVDDKAMLPFGVAEALVEPPCPVVTVLLSPLLSLGRSDIRRATGKRDFAGARSIAAVLHGRVQRIVGGPAPAAAASYRARTPGIGDPADRAFALALANAMDARVVELVNQAVIDRPKWALRQLGEIPADPLARADWTRLAAIAAAYREERGWSSETDPIGPAPERATPELRASWHAALRKPEKEREAQAAGDGELLARRAAYQRNAQWAPPHMARELREAHMAEDACRAAAVLAWHQAHSARNRAERSLARQHALELSSRAQQAGARRQTLEQIAEARAAWHQATEPARQQAVAADTELRRRHPAIDLRAPHPEEEHGASPLDVQTAARAAKHDMDVVTAHQWQAGQDIGMEHDDPLRPRQAEARAMRTALRQEPLRSPRAERQAQPDLEPEAGG